ncbi:hypothetical protein FG379_002821 [Cryptosporidium bovis]|uniref:uncharacterized protein n=1 Tax=Cryptosporidium bovis TaxID=310047 RepID=UPI003519F030|nr:hypothetical protein FG379_002821 [Cryptosporidium bovis]
MNLQFGFFTLFFVLSCYRAYCTSGESGPSNTSFVPSAELESSCESESLVNSDITGISQSMLSLNGTSFTKNLSGFSDVTGSLGLLIALTKNGSYSRIISGNFFKVNEGENSFYLLFDTTYKNFVGIFVSGSLDFTINGRLGKVMITHSNETFLLNKFKLTKGENDSIVTNSPWNLKIEVNPDYKKFINIPSEIKNRNIVKLPPADWDANLDSIYPSNIKSIIPISIMSKKDGVYKKLTIPHFSVGISPTALFLKLNTGEYMSVIVTNNTVFFVDIDDCSIHSSNGHYYNICGGYSIYYKRWFLTNKPWGHRVVINKILSDLYAIMKNKLDEMNDSDDVEGNPSALTGNLVSDKFKQCNRLCTKCKYND